MHALAEEGRRRGGEDAALRFILSLGHPDLAGGAEMLEAARRLEQVGMAGIAFCDDGRIGPAGLSQIKGVLAALDG